MGVGWNALFTTLFPVDKIEQKNNIHKMCNTSSKLISMEFLCNFIYIYIYIYIYTHF